MWLTHLVSDEWEHMGRYLTACVRIHDTDHSRTAACPDHCHLDGQHQHNQAFACT